MHDIDCMSLDELEEQYDIEVDDDGYVWDNLEGQGFDSLREWGRFIEERDSDEPEEIFIPRAGKRRYEDD
jgi:hypothetical protein